MNRWPVAIGALPGGGGGWAGIDHTGDGFHLVYGEGDLRWSSTASGRKRADELLAVAVAYFQESLPPPSANLEATQADLGDILRWLAHIETDAARERWLHEAVDAIDDGLPADVVIRRLSLARSGSDSAEQADVVDLLARRYHAVRRHSPGEGAP